MSTLEVKLNNNAVPAVTAIQNPARKSAKEAVKNVDSYEHQIKTLAEALEQYSLYNG
jgi:hypothetical protein